MIVSQNDITAQDTLKIHEHSVYNIQIEPQINNIRPLLKEYVGFLNTKNTSDTDITQWKLILTEAVANSIKHANTLINISWWQKKNTNYLKVSDYGQGIKNYQTLKIQLPKDTLNHCGRGLYIIKKYSDEIYFTKSKNKFSIIIKKSQKKADLIDDEKNYDINKINIEHVLTELGNAYESLYAFRKMGNLLIGNNNPKDFIKTALICLNDMLEKKIDLIYICISNKIYPQVTEILSPIKNVKTQEKTSPFITNIMNKEENFFWSKNDTALINDKNLQNHNYGSIIPILNEKNVLACIVVARKNHDFTDSEHSSLVTISDLLSIALTNANFQIISENEQKSRHELEIASNIQKNLLNIQKPPISKKWEINQFHISAQEVGGDYIHTCYDKNKNLTMTVIDVMGKGVSAAMVASLYRTAFQILISQSISLENLIHALNNSMCQQLEKMTMFITCTIIKIDKDLKNAEIVNAGHPPTIKFNGNSIEKIISASGPPLGLFKTKQNSYRVTKTNLKKNTALAVITDGLFEWKNANSDQKWWGWDNLTNYFQEKKLPQNPKIFWKSFIQFIEKNSPLKTSYDDRTLLLWKNK